MSLTQTAYDKKKEHVDILSCAQSDITLRDQQKNALLFCQDNWFDYDVFVIEAPTAVGKSHISTVLAEWLRRNNMGGSVVTTPTVMLQEQYLGDFPHIPMLKGADRYDCSNFGGSCGNHKRVTGECCKAEDGEPCSYLAARAAAQSSQVAILNPHSLYFSKFWKENLIIDEAHNCEEFFLGMCGASFWQFQAGYPKNLKKIGKFGIGGGSQRIKPGSVLPWLKEYAGDLNNELQQAKTLHSTTNDMSKEMAALEHLMERVSFIAEVIGENPDDILVTEKKEIFHTQNKEEQDKYRDYLHSKQNILHIKPLRVKNLTHNLWPEEIIGQNGESKPGPQKLVLLSATITEQDVETLNLADKKVAYFKCDNPIPEERRRIGYVPRVSMTRKNIVDGDALEKCWEFCQQIANKRPDEKGVIHATYRTAAYFKDMCDSDRFMFHTNHNKAEIYEEFMKTKKPRILVGSGISEGVDFKYDKARWQIISQVVKPSLADDVNFYLSQSETSKYNWLIVRQFIQTCGRISRAVDDDGVTYCPDKELERIYRMTHYDRLVRGLPSLWPDWINIHGL